MSKKPQQVDTHQDHLEESLPKFTDIESSVFSKVGNNIYIGRDKITPNLRNALRDEAKNLQTTRLWEILNATVANEAYDWALNKSEDMELVRSAKMLKHWIFVVTNIVFELSKLD